MKNQKYLYLSLLLLFYSLLISNYLSAQIPNIQLTTLKNKKTTFAELVSQNPLNVFMFYSPECPICQRNTLDIRQLSTKYAPQKVNFVFIYPANFNNKRALKRFEKKYQVASLISILDKDNQLVKLLNAQITPEYFLLNSEGKTLYSGAFDNAFVEIGKKRTVVTQFYLDDAIQQSINNKDIIIKRTEAIGCFITK